MVEHYTAILPFKRKNWVLCHQSATVENAIALEVYVATEARLYLIPKAWKKKGNRSGGGDNNAKELGCGEVPRCNPKEDESLTTLLVGGMKPQGVASWCFTCSHPGYF